MNDSSYVLVKNIAKARLWGKRAMRLGRLDLELTERCNNNCSHCYINLPAEDAAAQRKELSTEKIKDILREAVSLDCLTVRFTGGEPLLREDFQELYIFARKLGLRVLIFTNATLITPDLVELFTRIPPLERIEVTVYGMTKSSYEAVTRVKGSFDAFRRGTDLLLEKKIPFVVKGALLPANKDEIHDFAEWSQTIPWMERPPSYSMFFDLRCRRDGAKNELIKKMRVTPQEGLAVLIRNKDEYIKEMKEFCSKFMRPSGDKLFPCGAGCGGCVDAYGIFQPCLMLRDPDCGYDLKKGSLKDALENSFPKVTARKAVNAEYLATCARCFLKGLCDQCPAKSWTEHGALDRRVEYLCDVAHVQARFLGLIKDNENAWDVSDWRERINSFAGQKPASA